MGEADKDTLKCKNFEIAVAKGGSTRFKIHSFVFPKFVLLHSNSATNCPTMQPVNQGCPNVLSKSLDQKYSWAKTKNELKTEIKQNKSTLTFISIRKGVIHCRDPKLKNDFSTFAEPKIHLVY